jgi:hypothetical protein
MICGVIHIDYKFRIIEFVGMSAGKFRHRVDSNVKRGTINSARPDR